MQSSPNDRRLKIQELVDKKPIGTQTDLQRELRKSGITVNQATLSRDIKELGLIKIVSGGTYRYASRQISSQTSAPPPLTTIRSLIHLIDWSGNTVVIKTDTGAANHVAQRLDALDLPEVLGTVAGDDTLFLTVRRTHSAAKAVARLKKEIG